MKFLLLLIASILSVPSFAQEPHTIPVVGHEFKFDFGKYAFHRSFRPCEGNHASALRSIATLRR